MVNRATGSAVIMGREVRGVTRDALSATCHSRSNERTCSRVMAGSTAFGIMDFTSANKGRGSGSVTTHTVGSCRGGGNILLHLAGVSMVMAVEISEMTINT